MAKNISHRRRDIAFLNHEIDCCFNEAILLEINRRLYLQIQVYRFEKEEIFNLEAVIV